MSSRLSLGLESEGWVLSKADSRLFQPGITTFAHSVCAHTRLFMLPVDAGTQTVYIVCIHVYMYVLRMFLVCGVCTCTPRIGLRVPKIL